MSFFLFTWHDSDHFNETIYLFRTSRLSNSSRVRELLKRVSKSKNVRSKKIALLCQKTKRRMGMRCTLEKWKKFHGYDFTDEWPIVYTTSIIARIWNRSFCAVENWQGSTPMNRSIRIALVDESRAIKCRGKRRQLNSTNLSGDSNVIARGCAVVQRILA